MPPIKRKTPIHLKFNTVLLAEVDAEVERVNDGAAPSDRITRTDVLEDGARRWLKATRRARPKEDADDT